MKIFNIAIICIILMIPAITAFEIKINQKESYTITFNNFNISKKFDIPYDKEFDNIEVLNWQYQILEDIKPSVVFYTTEYNDSFEILQPIYENPYCYEILHKGTTKTLSIYVPSSYYINDTHKIQTSTITFKINLNDCDDRGKDFLPMGFDPQDEIEYLIITNETLWNTFYNNYSFWKVTHDSKIDNILVVNVSTIEANPDCWVNGSYGDATNTTEGNHWIDDGDEVTSNFEFYNDTQAKIRNYIRYCVDIYNTQYVLLAGNKNVLPPRMACSYAWSGEAWYNDTSHACDLYFAALHGTQNSNENTRWMENNCTDDGIHFTPFDDIDWGYDVLVGRVTVDTITRANCWINKSKAYHNGANYGNYLSSNIIAAKDNSNNIWAYTWNECGDEFSNNMTFVNNQNITQSQWEVMDEYVDGNISEFDGIHIIYHAGHGGTLYDTYGGVYRPQTCWNIQTPNFVYTEGCSSGDFGTDTNSRMAKWIRNDDCAVAGVANSAYGWFIASTYYPEIMFRYMFNTTAGVNEKIWCKAHFDSRDYYGHPNGSVWAMIEKEINFFGDPALEYNWGNSNPHFINISGGRNQTSVLSSNPTFKWTIIDNASQYWLQIAIDSTFTNLIVNLSNVSKSNFPSYYFLNETYATFTLPSLYNLSDYKTYYTRVRAYEKS